MEDKARWVQIRSWHTVERVGPYQTITTACGREVQPGLDHPLVEDLPSGKSCETCLRIIARRAAV